MTRHSLPPSLAPTSAKADKQMQQTRLVLCITVSAQAKLPTLSGLPSCLLPAGPQSLLERLLSQCAALGIKTVDLMVSEDPHAIRKIVGSGERWGLDLHWHWLADGQHLLQHIHKLSSHWLTQSSNQTDGLRLVIGRAHHWISTSLLGQLLERDMVLIHEDIADAHCTEPWTGWMSLSPSTCVNWCETGETLLEEQKTLTRLATGQIAPLQIASPDQLIGVSTGRDLLAVNQMLLQTPVIDQPVTWLHKPWGMMSPLAHVAENAQLVGPVCIGPGCWVMDGAQIGPNVNLTKDVVVHANTLISNTVVFEKTYIGSDLDIHEALVSANHLEHPMRQVSFALPVSDGRLLPLGQERKTAGRPRPSFLARLLAFALLLPLAPLAGLGALLARLCAQPLPWTVLMYADTPHPQGTPLSDSHAPMRKLRADREIPAQASLLQKWLHVLGLTFAAWLDIAQGHRCWVGIRPRFAQTPRNLPEDWQNALQTAPIGWLHAPAWTEQARTDRLWSEASADVFWIIQSKLSLPVWRRLKNSLAFRPW